jgi:SnoaL-like domain
VKLYLQGKVDAPKVKRRRENRNEEERAVQQVLAKYVLGADARDGAAVATLFTEAGRVEISYNNSGKLEPIGELVGQPGGDRCRGIAYDPATPGAWLEPPYNAGPHY